MNPSEGRVSDFRTPEVQQQKNHSSKSAERNAGRNCEVQQKLVTANENGRSLKAPDIRRTQCRPLCAGGRNGGGRDHDISVQSRMKLTAAEC